MKPKTLGQRVNDAQVEEVSIYWIRHFADNFRNAHQKYAWAQKVCQWAEKADVSPLALIDDLARRKPKNPAHMLSWLMTRCRVDMNRRDGQKSFEQWRREKAESVPSKKRKLGDILARLEIPG